MATGLEQLKIDTWYKALIAVAAAVLVATVIGGNMKVAIVAFGFLMIGFGEWINHPTTTEITPRYRLTYSAREPNIAGIATEILGGAVVLAGFYKLVV